MMFACVRSECRVRLITQACYEEIRQVRSIKKENGHQEHSAIRTFRSSLKHQFTGLLWQIKLYNDGVSRQAFIDRTTPYDRSQITSSSPMVGA
jgi:hypothetical protein